VLWLTPPPPPWPLRVLVLVLVLELAPATNAADFKFMIAPECCLHKLV